MEKSAPAAYQVHPLIQNRWSPRAISSQPIESWKICSLLEAARWAPSCFNEQPWRFFIGVRDTTPVAWQKIQGLLLPGNAWAKSAPVFILSVAKLNFTHNGEPNRHATHDVGLATGNMVLQAESLGLVSHQMGGFDVEKAVLEFNIPPGYLPMVVTALGYSGSLEQLNPELHARENAPRNRHRLQHIAFSDDWECAFPICFT